MRIIFILVSLTIIIFSCNKENVIEFNNYQNLQFEKYNATSNFEIKKLIYSQLDPEDRYKIWINHFDNVIKLNPPPKSTIILKLRSLINMGMFRENSEERLIFLNYEYPIWIKEAKAILTDQEIYNLVYEATNTATVADGGNQPVECFCHVGNNGFSCKTYTIGFPTMEMNIGLCVAGATCTGSKYGCGVLFLESCNGANCAF